MSSPQWHELPMSRTKFMVQNIFEPLKFDCIKILNKFLVQLESTRDKFGVCTHDTASDDRCLDNYFIFHENTVGTH